jgi:hypothetical protein
MTSSQRDMFGAPQAKAKASKPKPHPTPSAKPSSAPAHKLTPRQQQQRDAALASVRKEREQERVGDTRESDTMCEFHGLPLVDRLAEKRSGGGQVWESLRYSCAKCLQF